MFSPLERHLEVTLSHFLHCKGTCIKELCIISSSLERYHRGPFIKFSPSVGYLVRHLVTLYSYTGTFEGPDSCFHPGKSLRDHFISFLHCKGTL